MRDPANNPPRPRDRVSRAERKQQRRDARRTEKTKQRAFTKQRRAERAEALGKLWRRLRPAVPVALVTALAMFGQIIFVFDAIRSELPIISWVAVAVFLAIAIGVGYESISLHVQWHAHDSLLRGKTLTAARQRRASYAIAAVGALVNYSHFARDDWSPTILAVAFASFSLASPWLWGMHTRRERGIQLSREGQDDTSGAVFSAERYRAFPYRTWCARRWSIDHGVTDPEVAWEGYRAHERGRQAVREAERAMRRGARADRSDRPRWRLRRTRVDPIDEQIRTAPVAATIDGVAWPLRTAHVATDRDAAIVADLKLMAEKMQRRPGRNAVEAMYGMGAERAERLRGPRGLGWAPGRSVNGKPRPVGSTAR